MHVGVSGRGAPLAAPGRRNPDNLLGRIRDIGCCVHEGWVLAAEFEKDGSQILCSRFHDDLAYFDATGEEDEVERQLEKFCHLVLATCDGSYGSGMKIFSKQDQENLSNCGGEPRGSFRESIHARDETSRHVGQAG